MRTRRLGSRGPELSVVGLGAWEAGAGEEWGSPPPEQQVIEAIHSALEAGINWIDTAEVYGNGRSEEVVGRAVAGRREDVLIATKAAPRPEGTGFRPEEVRAACEGSLKRLGTQHIDLFQLHWPDQSGIPVEETWGGMGELVDAGLVRWIGVSNFDEDLIQRCLAGGHVDSLQPECSMLVPESLELIRWCGERGVGVVTYGSIAYGLLSGAFTAETVFDPTDFRSGFGQDEYWVALFAPGKLERSLAVVDGVRVVAERLGASVAQVAIAWNLSRAGATSAIVGSRNARHVRDNAAAGELELDESTIAELDALVPL